VRQDPWNLRDSYEYCREIDRDDLVRGLLRSAPMRPIMLEPVGL
jgi:hypothetical protein